MRERQTTPALFVQRRSEQRPQELTLGESLEGKTLTEAETRTARAIDVLEIPIQDKKTLFIAQLFLGVGGVSRADELGFSLERTVGARDSVMTNRRYEGFSHKLEFLLRPNFVEVASGKQRGLRHKQMAEVLRIPESKVESISSDLIAEEIIKPSPQGRAAANSARRRLMQLIPFRGELNASQIAAIVGSPQDSIRSVFKREVRRRKIPPLDKRGVVERDPRYVIYLKVREGIARLRDVEEPRYTEKEIADILTRELEREVTIQMVKRQIRLLLRDGKIERRIN